MSDIVLAINNITKHFGLIEALKNISLTLRKGRVHTLLGENGAGKSTLMKILAGVYPPTSGELIYKGQPIRFKNPAESRKSGIAIIFQELSLSNNLTIAENIYANREPQRFGIIDEGKMQFDAQKLLNTLGIDLDSTRQVSQMSMAQRQLVEIAKALSVPADVVIMDEPTSSLSDNEAAILFRIIGQLKQQGCAIIYISHRMDEIMQISDDISVIRDGEYIATHDKNRIDINTLIAQMVGREIKNIYPPRQRPAPATTVAPRLEVKNLHHAQLFKQISFAVRPSEILGFFGLIGSGRSDVMKALFGLLPYRGEIFIDGHISIIKTPATAIKQGMAFVTENRQEEGLVLGHDVNMNINHIGFQYFSSPFGLLRVQHQQKMTGYFIDKMNIKTHDATQQVASLSGGNQQKIVFAKWLEKTPRILILDEPTRGVDVGAKLELYHSIRELSASGTAIILVSSELPEVIALSDRLMVMRQKRIVAEYQSQDLNQADVMRAATGAL